jgi:hypothetical protein
MKGLTFPAMLLVALAARYSGVVSASSLCQASETVPSTCEVGTKTVSICREKQDRAVCRLGRPRRVELQLTDPHFVQHAFPGGGETQVYAGTSTDRYLVYNRLVRTSIHDDGRFDPREESGLLVRSRGRTISNRQCTEPATFDWLTWKFVPAGDYVPH